jgi:hypothetical protein
VEVIGPLGSHSPPESGPDIQIRVEEDNVEADYPGTGMGLT